MPTRSTRTVSSYHWLPPTNSCLYKVVIVATGGTEYDFTETLAACRIKDGATDMIGSFEIEIYDPNLDYQNVFTGMEQFSYYSDYETTATTLRFKGRIEKINYKQEKLVMSGRSEALFIADKSVTKSYTDTEAKDIIQDMIDSYGDSRYTYSNLTQSSISLTVNWYQKPFMDCIKEICTATGFDFYIDCNNDAHFFEVNSVRNTTDAMVHEMNLFETGDFADDLSQIRNRIIVYGAEQDGIQLIYTSEDAASQSLYGIKEEIINDNNLTTYTQCQEYADYRLAQSKNPPKIGEVTGMMLATIQPGEAVLISDPINNIQPGYYQVISYEHNIIDYTTVLNISKEPRRFSHILKSLVETSNLQSQTSINPYEMRFSYVFLFDTDEGTHTNTQITNGVLSATGAGGYWTSDTRSLSTPLDEAYLVMKAEDINNVTVQFSGDNGAHWVTITNKEKLSAGNAAGTNLKLRITFAATSASVDSISLMYKVEA